MEDYTKFKLKSEDKLAALLEGKDSLFVIACNKCFKEFHGDEEPERSEFIKLAQRLGKSVAGSLSADFLCNKSHTAKMLERAANIFVISCGLGVQTVADLTELPVYAAADSVGGEGQHGLGKASHGLALTKLRCEACGQCYLNHTGGICPIVDCSKSLVNGQCGGAKDGMCEADKDKDCAWEKIYESLSEADRVSELTDSPVLLRDYSKVSFKLISGYVKSIREKRLDGYYGGLHPHEGKELSEHIPLAVFPAPQTVVIPLLQHTGAPAKPLVKAGDNVKTGQKIGEAAGFISSPVHSSVSGIVKAVEPRRHPNTGLDVLSVVIESDGKNELHESVKPPGALPFEDLSSLAADDIIGIVRDKGIAGMGGAGFPTSVKLKSPKPIDTVLLNGCECEPLLTADYRVMLEYPDDIIFGLRALLKAAGAQRGVIAIEDNKPGAIKLISTKADDIPNIEVIAVKTKYPQGAERMLIKRVLGRSVPSGALPLDVGVVVSNVSTAKAVSDAIQKGMPLIERAVTVSGEKIKNPGNFIVKTGTSVKEIIDYCGGLTGRNTQVLLGGPMMGNLLTAKPSAGGQMKDPLSSAAGFAYLDVPVIKTTGGIIAIEPPMSAESPCIRCGRCVDACPMELLPLYYPVYAGKQNWEGMKDKAVKDCIECGCCDFICPSKIPIREAIKAGKQELAKR